MRTQNAGRLLDDDYLPRWGSYFPSIGVLVPPDRLTDGSNEAFDFLEHVLNISPEHLLIRISSNDTDLMNVVSSRYKADRVEIDSRNPKYYRHKFGMRGVRGRNFNIALEKPGNNNSFSDVGNIIVIENEKEQLGVEIALGTTTILKELHGLNHVQECTPVIGIGLEDEVLRRKMEDAIIVSTVLFNEGLRPSLTYRRLL